MKETSIIADNKLLSKIREAVRKKVIKTKAMR